MKNIYRVSTNVTSIRSTVNLKLSDNFKLLIHRAVFLLFLAVGTITVHGATFVVTKTADTNDGVCDADCSLREALATVNATAGDDHIVFSGTVFNTGQTITLSGGLLNVTNNGAVTVSGPGVDLLTISGNNATRVFSVNAGTANDGAILTVSGLTIANGYLDGGSSALWNGQTTIFTNVVIRDSGAGAVTNVGNLTINNSTIINNAGMGIYNDNGTLAVNDSVISNNVNAGIWVYRGTTTVRNSSINYNTAGGLRNQEGIVNLFSSVVDHNMILGFNNDGGGILNFSGDSTNHPAILNVTNSTISNNSAFGQGSEGGGIMSNGSVVIAGSSIINNRSGAGGGGIINYYSMSIKNSTISNNVAATEGGGIYNWGYELNLTNVTIARNFADSDDNGSGSGGGIYNRDGNTVNARNSLIGDNFVYSFLGPDFFGVVNSQGYNLVEQTNSTTINGVTTGNITGLDPQIGPLSLNGGPTTTHALSQSSPAIDAADPNNIQPKDQRGVIRPQDGNADGINRPDIGAFERGVAIFSRPGFDFDGDAKTDLSIFRPSNGEWWYQRSSNGQVAALQFGLGTDKIVPGDFTGDGKTDIAFWRPSSGEWFILRSEDSTFFAFPFGSNGDIPAPADYDGDGRTDPAVFRPTTTTWFISNSGGSGVGILNFGLSTDKPVVADYDGDSKADIAIWRAGPGEWWGRRSTNGSVFAVQFGATSDRPVQGDYTGDGKADIAFWRPSTGFWFVQRSEDNSFFSFPFGTTGDIPVAGDYDGDGRQDAAVFRPSTATWFANRSTAGTLIQQFGLSTDTPVPSAFVP